MRVGYFSFQQATQEESGLTPIHTALIVAFALCLYQNIEASLLKMPVSAKRISNTKLSHGANDTQSIKPHILSERDL